LQAEIHLSGKVNYAALCKIWLEPEIEVARPGRTLKRHALGQALKVIFDTFALGKWTINKTMRNFFNTMYRACVYTVDC
jgi:hypothetical protein